MRKEIDVLKAVAILTVIILHYNAFLFARFPVFSLYWFGVFSIDRLARFCVPLFVALSGFLLATKYLTAKLILKDFYLRRVTKLLPAYIFWSTLIYLALHFANNVSIGLNPADWLQMFVFGHADYHLYFVPMIFQLYLLFPFLFYLTRKSPWATLGFGLLLQLATFYYYQQNPQFNDQEQYIHFASWIYYFILGIFLAQNSFSNFKNKLGYFVVPFITVLGLCLSLINSSVMVASHIDLILATNTFRPENMLYATGIILAAIFYADKIGLLPNWFLKVMGFIGVESYVVYLCHTLFLRPIFFWIAPDIPQGNSLIILAFGVGGLLLTFIPSLFRHAGAKRLPCKG